MIGVTERAKQELKNILRDNVDHPEACLRLTVNPEGQLGLGVDVAGPDDNVVEHEGSYVLLVEPDLATRLVGISLDVEDNPEGSKLVVVSDQQDE